MKATAKRYLSCLALDKCGGVTALSATLSRISWRSGGSAGLLGISS